jgi:hypothetical protein
MLLDSMPLLELEDALASGAWPNTAEHDDGWWKATIAVCNGDEEQAARRFQARIRARVHGK